MAGDSSEDDANAATAPATPRTAADPYGTIPASRESRPLETFHSGSKVGRYVLKTRLGAGAMGVVWSAHDPKLDREVAVKLVHPELSNEEAKLRLMREARAMAKLSHRNVVVVHDADDLDGTLFITMELVRGTTLGHLLRERDAAAIANWRKWLPMMVDAGRGLAEAHRNGVLHRDFKPDNVLVDRAGRVCVSDFGLAALGDMLAGTSRQWTKDDADDGRDDESSLELTRPGSLLGTPIYMSPQQLHGEPIDARADQFAFCVATWEALYGTRPFVVHERGLDAIAALSGAIVKGPPPPPSSAVPEAVREVLVRGLALDPDARYPTMEALLAALEQAARRPATVVQSSRRRSWPYYAIAVGAVIAIGLGVFAFTRPSRPGSVSFVELFSLPLNTRMAISPSGKMIAIGADTLEVRSADPAEGFSTSVTVPGSVLYVELDDEVVRFSLGSSPRRWRWRYREGTALEVETEDVGGRWRGTTVAGELVRIGRSLGIAAQGKVTDWGVGRVEVVAISPNRKRVAYIEGGRFTGLISVREVETGKVIKSPVLAEPTSIAWENDQTLIYATSTLVEPTLNRVEVTSSFGAPEVIYREATGWFSDLAVSGGQLYVVSMTPTPRGRVIERDERGIATRRIELDSVTLGVGWDPRDTMVTWNASNKELRKAGVSLAKLPSEPANATMLGDTVIAAMRELGGRRALAVPLGEGVAWRHVHLHTIVVRCAVDRVPPCFAVRNVSEERDEVFAIDPETGTLGATPIYAAPRIEDIAVSADGQRIAVVGFDLFLEIDPTGAELVDHTKEIPKSNQVLKQLRSIAYDPLGGFLVAGTAGRNNYQIGRYVDGQYEVLDDVRDKIVALVRPDTTGRRVASVARGYEPKLFRLIAP